MGSGPAAAPEPEGSSGSQATSGQLLLSMNDFANFKQIGKGKDCVVYAASCEKLGGHSVVLKVYDKSKISAIKHRSVRREARIMRYLTDKRIPHTTAYTGAFQDSKQIYIVMEHCKGGDLLEQLLKEGRAMPEKRVVREVVLPTLTALAHLHAAGIIHRDIKLENLFISSRGHLQLGDFGLAISVLEERAISPVGTLEYMAPEILRLPSTDLVLKGLVRVEDISPIDEKVDLWSFGVTVYELVTGRSPFEGSNKDEIKAAILNFQMRALPSFLTPGCQDFILKCLCPKAGDRPSALGLLSHPWVQLHCTPADLVTIARLPLQLPKVPMGYRQPSSSSLTSTSTAAAAAAGSEQQAQQQRSQPQASSAAAAATEGSMCSSSATVVAPQSPGLTPREAVAATAVPAAAAAAAKASPPALMQGPETKIHANTSTTSSPDSPQIPAFMPPGAGQVCPAGVCSNASVASASCGHMERHVHGHGHSCSSSSRSSNSSSIMQGTAAHGPPSIDHTASTESMRSHGGVSMNDSVTSMYQQSLAAAAAGVVGSSGKNWSASAAPAAAGPASANGWAQEPIQESPTDESAAAAASLAGHSGQSENPSCRGDGRQQQPQQQLLQPQEMQLEQQQRQQQLAQQQQQHQPSQQQQPQLASRIGMQQALLDHIATSKLLAAQQAAAAAAAGGGSAGGSDKLRGKTPNGGKRLWKWMCVAAGAASPNASQ